MEKAKEFEYNIWQTFLFEADSEVDDDNDI